MSSMVAALRLQSGRPLLVVGLLLAAVFVTILLAIGFGSTWIPLEAVTAVLLGGGDDTQRLIILQLRMPRVAIAALAGGAMGVAGYLLQKVTRNALAAPGILGVVDGAGLGVVVFLALFSGESNTLTIPIVWQPLAAVIGAGLAIAMVFTLAGRQASSAIRLLLFGIAVAAVCKAVIMILMLVGPIYRATQAARWLAGAVNEINWGEIQLVALCLVPTLLVTLLVARQLPPTDLDEVSARGVGLNLPVFRIGIFSLAALLTALAVCFAGAISFVGLLAPHLARLLVGRGVLTVIIGSFLVGATMLVGADLVVRALFAPTEVPAGTVTAVVGTPYFLYLLMQKERHSG